MPKFLKWIGDAMETVLASKYLQVTVDSVTYLSPQIKKIRFKGDYSQLSFSIGYAVSFRVTETEFRNYTPILFDQEKGICEIIFHLHGNGPGSVFVSSLIQGEQLKMIIPRGREIYQQDKQFHVFFGDETSMGLFNLLASEIIARRQHYIGMIEMDEENLGTPAKLGLDIAPVLKSPQQPGKNITASLGLLKKTLPEFFFGGVFYLVGNAVSIQVLKSALRELGVSVSNIKTQAYWAEGKTGL